MAEALEIIFRSFWTFAGTVVLTGTLTQGLAQMISAVRATAPPKTDSNE